MGIEQSSWVNFLQQQGATLVGDRVTDFGNATTELQWLTSGTVLVPLTHLGLLRASGQDTADFLQGQTSNDVRLVDAEHHQLNSYCTAKGRMLALFILFMRDADYYLQLPQELLAAVQKRLGMFIMRSAVKLEEAGSELVSFGLGGPQADSLLTKALGDCPAEPGHALTLDGVTLLRRPGEAPRFICLATPERLQALWLQLTPEATPVGADGWELLEIRAGIPQITGDTVEAFVPQMVNLQLIDGVNFKKGCYPGQEVVARMQYLGKLKRRMYRAYIDLAAPPAAGTDLYAADSQSAQGAGKVVRASRTPEGGCELLVVAEIASAQQQTLHLKDADGPRLDLRELPYRFIEQEHLST